MAASALDLEKAQSICEEKNHHITITASNATNALRQKAELREDRVLHFASFICFRDKKETNIKPNLKTPRTVVREHGFAFVANFPTKVTTTCFCEGAVEERILSSF